MTGDPIVIVGGARTPIGRFGGALSAVEAHELGACAIRAALERSGVGHDDVDEVIMGQVGQVGRDAYNARRCMLSSGIPTSATALNINRLCGSGLQSIVTGAHQLMLNEAEVVVAGGNESMSRQPFLDYGARDGWRLGDRKLLDGAISLVTDPWGEYPMGETAERVAERYDISREEQDAFAVESQSRAARALADHAFTSEIVPVSVPRGDAAIAVDEQPRAHVTATALARLKPVFRADGTVTAGNSSSLNDGAAAVVMMRRSAAERRGLQPRIRFVGATVCGIDPEIMGYAPALAIPRLLAKADVPLEAVEVIELNEAFAAQAVAVIRNLDLDPVRVNPDGGAIAFGHPVGATGAILAVKLMHSLERRQARYGIVSMCIGGGQGIAALFESAANP